MSPRLSVCAPLSCCVLQSILTLNASDTMISFLPLAHIYEQQLQVSVVRRAVWTRGSSLHPVRDGGG